MMRIGQGFDVHKFGGNGPIVLGGVQINYAQGLLAHSDGDVLLHALTDALLGALAMGDIGQHFPDNDENYANIDSRILLRHAYSLIQNQHYTLSNCDMTIIAQSPKMAPHILQMRQNIAEDLQATIDQVSIKPTTTETLGFTGRKEGIACQAIVLLESVQHNGEA
jgi:2-C-methyl-D-erythritol 2,4-cyclodiphosphate synthase